MGNSRAINGYEDAYKIFELALASSEPIAFDYPTEGQAIKFLTRAGSYRRMIRRDRGSCAYDTLRLSRTGRTITITSWVDTIPQPYNPRTGAPITLPDMPSPYEDLRTYNTDAPETYDANTTGHHSLPDDWGAEEPYQKPVDNPKNR